MLENIVNAPKDPILGLVESFNADLRKQKINLSVGVYKDQNGKTPILRSVKKAEEYLLKKEITKNYLPISGNKIFAILTQSLLFTSNHPVIIENRARTIQALGGTGALHLAAEFIAKKTSCKRIWLSKPTWHNHNNIFKNFGLKICYYNYYDSVKNKLDFSGMLSNLDDLKSSDVLLLHGCCHNPTGIDLSKDQWEILSKFVSEKKVLPIFDFAYQGFAKSLEKDVEGLQIFSYKNPEIIVATSYSKNFSLYNERIGACTIIASDKNQADCIFSQMQSIVRANYSSPPFHGAAIVTTILSDEILKKEWIEELTIMRQRIQRMRQLLVNTLFEKGAKKDFNFINKQNGMFSFSGLTESQVIKLREKYGIYIVHSGRINVAGLMLENIVPLCKAIIDVL
ncbi:MAG: amino acid aminotransferase [Arsenophonus sp.]|nr:MAG: amino acid aminotransferase [Arsenophonus sp.]